MRCPSRVTGARAAEIRAASWRYAGPLPAISTSGAGARVRHRAATSTRTSYRFCGCSRPTERISGWSGATPNSARTAARRRRGAGSVGAATGASRASAAPRAAARSTRSAEAPSATRTERATIRSASRDSRPRSPPARTALCQVTTSGAAGRARTATRPARSPCACTTSTPVAASARRSAATARASAGVGLAGISTGANRAPTPVKSNWSWVAAGPQTSTDTPAAVSPRATDRMCCPTPPVLEASTRATEPGHHGCDEASVIAGLPFATAGLANPAHSSRSPCRPSVRDCGARKPGSLLALTAQRSPSRRPDPRGAVPAACRCGPTAVAGADGPRR